MANKENSQSGLILFNGCKREQGLPDSNLRKLTAFLKQKYRVAVNQSEISLESLAEAKLVILAGPHEMFSHPELEALSTYIQGGGNVLILYSEGGEGKLGTNLNYLLEEFGMSVNNDTVIRTVYNRQYFHPKENAISNGIINREISNFAKGKLKTKPGNLTSQNFVAHLLKNDGVELTDDHGGLTFLYPYGASINVQKPAIPILSSGPISYPLNRPIAAVYTSKARKGRLMVVGSYHMFTDNYIEKEDNSKLMDILTK